MPRAVTALLALTLLLGASCSDDASDDDPDTDVTTTTTTATDGSTTTLDEDDDGNRPDPGGTGPDGGGGQGLLGADPSSQDVCDALPAETVAAATGVEITGTDGDVGATPQCVYSYRTADGAEGSLTVGVPRPEEDLDGLTGDAALEFAVRANEQIFEVEAETLDIADGGAYVETGDLRNVLVLAGDRVITAAAVALERDQLVAVAEAAAAAFG